MSQTFVVELVEGGIGIVAEGDPAYPLCRDLQKTGYSNLVLSHLAFATGRVKDSMRFDDTKLLDLPDDDRIVRTAAFADQAAHIEEDRPCVHHWKIETPEAGAVKVSGRCKYCGAEKEDFDPWGPVSTESKDEAVRFIGKGTVVSDWYARLKDAEQVAGVYRKAA